MSVTNEKSNPMSWDEMMSRVNPTAWCSCDNGHSVSVEDWELFDVFVMVGGSTPQTAKTLRRLHGFFHPACKRMTQEG